MLDQSHDFLFVAASLALALMAGFTGLSLTRGASGMTPARRKSAVALAAVALGGGIWSMHFVAMLGLQLPIQFYYDGLVTLMSALLAILITGLALLLVHFGDRTPRRIVAAGATVGIGILIMHYVGMSGMQLCRPVYSVGGVVLAFGASLALSIAAFWIAYGRRDARGLVLGTVGFALAVFAVHFIAMSGTGFIAVPDDPLRPGRISNEVLAFGVTLAAFVISGGFLLTGATFGDAAPEPARPVDPPAEPDPMVEATPPVPSSAPDPAPEPAPEPVTVTPPGRIPYEQDGRIHFVAADDVAAIRAEGHYTLLYVGANRLFCPWSITEAETRLNNPDYMRTHRSYLVNRHFVSSFERKKDTGVCYFDGVGALPKVPVSRSRIAEVRAHLGV